MTNQNQKPAERPANPIRLEDLLPRENVRGGHRQDRVIFGMLNRRPTPPPASQPPAKGN